MCFFAPKQEEKIYYAKKSVSKNGVCVYHGGDNGTRLCVLQPVCGKWKYPDGGKPDHRRDRGAQQAGRGLHVWDLSACLDVRSYRILPCVFAGKSESMKLFL